MADDKRKTRTAEDEPERATFEIRAALDRVEDGDTAVLLLEDEEETQFDLPLSRLPEGSTDGDHFLLTFEEDGGSRRRKLLRVARDEQSKADAAARIRSLQERLARKSDTAGKKDFKL